MRTAELETVVRDSFEQAGLMAAMNDEKSQFLELSDGFFAEIVLNDASKLAGAERIVRSVKEQLEEKGVPVDSIIVRAVWGVQAIEFIHPARSLSGGLKAALEFEAILESGSRQCRVSVELTLAALNRLREKLALQDKVGFPGWAKDADVDEDTLRKVVAEFLDFKLSSGGASYWDPLLFPKLELNESVISYLIPDTKALQQLQAAIDRFFGEMSIEDSLETLKLQHVVVRNFHHVLSELPIGRSFAPGQGLANAVTLYQSLGEVERKRLEQYYSKKVSEIPEDLKREYAVIFSN